MFADDQAEAVPLSNVSMSALESHYARSALHSGWISANGPYVRQFERLLSLQTGTEHVIAMSSGTSALELALRALGIGSGHEVIIPALTFAAPASAVITVGATPVFADISAATWTLDPQSVALATSPKTRALIAVDIFGHPCDYDQLEQFGYPIIEDAAEAFGAEYKGRPAGSLGIVSVFSFHANKVTTTGEGGCVTTNDTDIADRVRLLNNHGMESDRPYWHLLPGHNRRMTNVAAAIGVAQLERSSELIGGRRQVAKFYDEAFRGLLLDRRPVERWARESIWLYTTCSDRRNDILRSCNDELIDARAIWPLLAEVPAFTDVAKLRVPIPVARYISARAFWLPTWSKMPVALTRKVADTVRGCLLAS